MLLLAVVQINFLVYASDNPCSKSCNSSVANTFLHCREAKNCQSVTSPIRLFGGRYLYFCALIGLSPRHPICNVSAGQRQINDFIVEILNFSSFSLCVCFLTVGGCGPSTLRYRPGRRAVRWPSSSRPCKRPQRHLDTWNKVRSKRFSS